MNPAMKLIRCTLIVAMFAIAQAHADDQQEVKQLIQKLYKEDVKALLCVDQNGERNEQLLTVSARYFSVDFMKYYRQICINRLSDSHGYALWASDPRTGQSGLFLFADSKAEFSNLRIGNLKITGNHAQIRVTYDFPDFSHKTYGNFTVFTLIKENGQRKIDDIELGGHELDVGPDARPTKSLKQHIKKGLEAIEAKKKTPKNKYSQ